MYMMKQLVAINRHTEIAESKGEIMTWHGWLRMAYYVLHRGSKHSSFLRRIVYGQRLYFELVHDQGSAGVPGCGCTDTQSCSAFPIPQL
jgi:hypothetical protein